ncbi:MAG TPA: nucleotidyltransferase family protein [Thermoanaerobaculia bacterium]|jgi:CTP:molybdopterin cytidylyltransferase MocA|nr:nucleotidyltransferase family protein [Thermoanaerobaculia bacterium]
MRVVAIVLAAGSSTRLGRPKQSIVLDGETLLERAERVARSVADEVIVVTQQLNPDAAEGIASSIRTGVRLAGDDARIIITLCDQPLITAEHLRALLDVDAPIAATGYAGTAGVPAVFAPSLVPELLALRGDRGARAVIEAHRDIARVVPFEDAAVDIDREDDVRELLQRH